MTTTPTPAANSAAGTQAVAPSHAYVVMMPGYGYPLGTQITNAATIARLQANGTLDRFTVRVALTQEK
ncbi:hypothetical protein K6L44_06505 [Gluconacetobacter entanii]|uniref:hypothetical protein n=1 Tax=Gluconacetobacter entanii TaxID=108528 RepID=UPI001C932870|nr:hypothetical protein [Gluconacetobacter entanii]BCZ76059.1 hypothetical protein [Komagataeibacter phage phiKX1]BCZ76132.1 hypothetical protein [Komagataeibacter phage phiKX2]MBY4639652.1 hypothetical protein [Gluconacetobacter entanii]MCW4579652.1 hypothetical protein [Gluconacetobacter entanii]MCW4583058.1 hypothetical protein [Gluconacetobacter entanii]